MSSQLWVWSRKCDFYTDMNVAHSLIQEVLAQLIGKGWNAHDLFAVEMAMEESLANAIHHGNNDNPLKMVHFSCQLADNLVRIQIEDEGKGFDSNTIVDPRDPENIERVSGRGVFLIHSFMTRVEYSECGRRLTMEKEMTKPSVGPAEL